MRLHTKQAKIHRSSSKVSSRIKNKCQPKLQELNLSSNKCLLPTCSSSPIVSKHNHQLVPIRPVFNISSRRRLKWLRLRSRPRSIILMKTTKARSLQIQQTLMETKEPLSTTAEGPDVILATHECSLLMAKSEIVTSYWLLHWSSDSEGSETDSSTIAFNAVEALPTRAEQAI